MTVAPVLDACIAMGAHYIDISNELSGAAHVFAQDARLRKAGIGAIPAAGFGTVATDAAAAAAVAALPSATALELCMFGDNLIGGPGTASSVVDVLVQGGVRLEGGRVVHARLGSGATRVTTPRGSRTMVPVATADILVTHHTTGVPDIAAGVSFGAPAAALAVALPMLSLLARAKIIRSLPEGRQSAEHVYHSSAWARATSGNEQASVWLETGEGYAFTASSVVHAVLATLASRPVGATTVAAAFGADFALRVPGTTIGLQHAAPQP